MIKYRIREVKHHPRPWETGSKITSYFHVDVCDSRWWRRDVWRKERECMPSLDAAKDYIRDKVGATVVWEYPDPNPRYDYYW